MLGLALVWVDREVVGVLVVVLGRGLVGGGWGLWMMLGGRNVGVVGRLFGGKRDEDILSVFGIRIRRQTGHFFFATQKGCYLYRSRHQVQKKLS